MVLGERERRLLVAVAAGFTLHLAFPRPGWDLIGWVALAPILALAVTARSARAAYIEGWVAGLAFFVPLLRWLTHTMSTFSTLPPPLASGVVILLAAYLALYWGAVTWAVALGRRLAGPRALWLAPLFWVTAELGRTHLLSGFPWGLLGYVPYRRLAVIQLAAWTGVYGVSALVVLVNTALAWAFVDRRGRAAALAAAVVALAVGGAVAVGTARLAAETPAPTVAVAVVQGNIDQAVKWDAGFRATTLDIYGALTREAAPGSRLVVWPEAAVPAYLSFEPDVVRELSALADSVRVPILVGAPDARPEGRVTRYLNSAFLLGAGVTGRYDKMHLVPFGEYVPLKRLLFFVSAIAAEIGDFTPGERTTVFTLGGTPFGTVICYEVVFPDLFRRFVAEGASFMTNITNDAWFGDSGGPLQHLAMVPLRAVENRVAIVRAANTGVSALVMPSGEIRASIPLGRRGVLRGDVPVRSGGTTYTRVGDLFAYACAVLSAATIVGVTALRGRA